MNVRVLLAVAVSLGATSSAESCQEEAKIPRERYSDRQVAQMLDDRPDMQHVFPDVHPVVVWVRERFETGDCRRRIIWDYVEPSSGQPAEHLASYGNYSAAVRISKNKNVTGRDKWVMLVFELHNIEYSEHRRGLILQLMRHQISVEQFVAESTEFEHRAVLDTVTFLNGIKMREIVTDEDLVTLKLLSTPASFTDFVKSLDGNPDGSYDPREFHRKCAEAIMNHARLR